MNNGKTAEAQKRLAAARCPAGLRDPAVPDRGRNPVGQQTGRQAWKVLQQALQQYPDDLNLLYTRAMLAEKRNDLAQMEKDLRLIIKRDPDNAMALNALGYTLSDRTTRYAEAKALIEQAHQINPEDPAVLDSLGWVNFRMGNWTKPNVCCARRERFPTTKSPPTWAKSVGQWQAARSQTIWGKFLKEQPDSPSCAAPSSA
jgi:Flp pilus assembly protein TadD